MFRSGKIAFPFGSKTRQVLALALVCLPSLAMAINPPTPPGFVRLGTINNWSVARGGMAYVSEPYSNKGLYTIDRGVLYKIDEQSGTRTALGSGRYLPNLNGSGQTIGNQHGPCITSLKGSLYISANNYLYRVNPGTGAFTQLGGASWDRADYITSSDRRDKLYIMHAASIYQVDPTNGAFTRLTGAWWNLGSGFTACGNENCGDDELIVIHNGGFYSFPADNQYLNSAPSYPNYPINFGAALVSWNSWQGFTGSVEMLSNPNLLETSIAGQGGYSTISSGYWRLYQSMTTGYYNLFIISDGALFRRDCVGRNGSCYY